MPTVAVQAGLARAGLERSRGRIEPAVGAAESAIATARGAGLDVLELRALGAVLEALIETCDGARIRRHADRTLALAQRLGVPTMELRAIGARAAAGVFDGGWAGADRDLARALALSRRFEVPRSVATVLALRATLQIMRGDVGAAESTLGEAQRHADQVPQDRHVAGDVALARGRLALARDDRPALERVLPALLRPEGRNIGWRRWTAAQALIALGRPEQAAEVASALRGGDPEAVRAGLAGWAAGLVSVDAAVAATQLDAAAAAMEALRLPYWAAACRVDALERTAGGEAARATAERTLETLEAMGARRDADRARRVLRRMGARPRPVRRPGVSGGPLSARELEIARLFAEGLTTAEVAARLVLSPHTATAHLRRIYERLEVHSRAALTRVLAERGLLGAG